MKYLLLLSVIALFMLNCNTSTTGKIKSAIEDYESNGNNIEHLSIDSVRFSKGGLELYYFERLRWDRNMLDTYKYLLNSARETQSYSLIVHLIYSIEYIESKMKFIDSLTKKASLNPQVYKVDYHLDKQTDKNNFNGHRQIFLYVNDLSEVYINTDSLYKHSKLFVSNPHDSTTDVHFLMMNDSLLAEKKRLSNELQLKIAGGTNILTIDNYQLKMAELQYQYARNKLIKIYLYVE